MPINGGQAALFASSLERLGNGMFMYVSSGPPSAQTGCDFEDLTELAPYVRVGCDTTDSFEGCVNYKSRNTKCTNGADMGPSATFPIIMRWFLIQIAVQYWKCCEN